MANPPRVGYSESTLQARGSILQGALETLLDPVARKDYDERLMLGDVVEEVPPEYVPGACLSSLLFLYLHWVTWWRGAGGCVPVFFLCTSVLGV